VTGQGDTGNAVSARRWARMLARGGHAAKVVERFDSQEADVLLALHARRSAGSVARFHAAFPARPIVLALTGTDLYSDLGHDDDADGALELATRIVVLQAAAPAALPAHLRARARVIEQSVEVPADLPARPVTSFDVCVLGHLRRVKDPFRAALAARDLPEHSRVRVLHLGAALEPQMAAAARAEEARNPRYDWRGEVPRQEALRTLAACHLHVLSSEMEGGANAVCEALALGVPTLSSRIAGSLGLLGDDYPGYFPFGDTPALTALLERAETEAHFYAFLARHTAERAYLVDPAREARAWAALMEELAQRA
jgi:putative glycosyltransferase (TIGR04348 family)